MAKYTNFSIRPEVGDLFKKYTKKQGKNYSDVLEYMLFYIIEHDIDIFKDDDEHKSLVKLINNRTNAMISILKNIEKYQTKPTANLVAVLFEQLAQATTDERNFSTQDKPQRLVLKSKKNLE